VTIAWYALGAVGALMMSVALAGCGGSSSHSGPPPSSGGEALWVANSGGFVSEFAGSTLKKSGSPDATLVNLSADLSQPWGLIFDSGKNLWVSNVLNGTLTWFTFAQLKGLKQNDAPAAAVVISGLNRPEGMVFDASGNLWVANQGNAKLLEFTPSQLETSGSPTPNIVLSSSDLASPVGIVFDDAGDIWVGDNSEHALVMFTAAQLGAGGTQPASVILTDDGSGSLDQPEPVTFDADGNLWVANNTDPVEELGSVVKFTADQLTASGSPAPAVTLTATTVNGTTANSFDDPAGITFDRHGNLWVANLFSDQVGSVAEFSAADLATSGSPQPLVFIDSNAAATNLKSPLMLTFGPSIK
jgi:secreted PhoX family phosphatase